MKKDWLTLLSLMGFWFGALIAFIIFIMNLPVYLVIAVAILSLISGFCFFTQVLFPGTVLFRDIGILHDNASLINSSGRMIASSLCASNLYAMGRGMSLPVVKVSLYPKGIWIKLPFIKPIGLFYEEIKNFSTKRLFLNIIEIKAGVPEDGHWHGDDEKSDGVY